MAAVQYIVLTCWWNFHSSCYIFKFYPVIGTVSRDFWQFFCLKNSIWASMNRQKRFCELFCFREMRKTCVHVVNDYADTQEIILLLKNLKTNKKVTTNVIWFFFKLSVRVVVDYADTFGKLWRALTDFKGIISQKRYLFRSVYSYNGQNLKTWKYPYLKKISGIHVVVDYAVGWSDFEK